MLTCTTPSPQNDTIANKHGRWGFRRFRSIATVVENFFGTEAWSCGGSLIRRMATQHSVVENMFCFVSRCVKHNCMGDAKRTRNFNIVARSSTTYSCIAGRRKPSSPAADIPQGSKYILDVKVHKKYLNLAVWRCMDSDPGRKSCVYFDSCSFPKLKPWFSLLDCLGVAVEGARRLAEPWCECWF